MAMSGAPTAGGCSAISAAALRLSHKRSRPGSTAVSAGMTKAAHKVTIAAAAKGGRGQRYAATPSMRQRRHQQQRTRPECRDRGEQIGERRCAMRFLRTDQLRPEILAERAREKRALGSALHRDDPRHNRERDKDDAGN